MNNIEQKIRGKVREALEEDPILKDRLDFEKTTSRPYNLSTLESAIRKGEERKKLREKFIRQGCIFFWEPSKEYYNHWLRRELYYLVLLDALQEKITSISRKLVKWREEICNLDEFYGVLATYNSNIVYNTIDYFMMTQNSNYVEPLFDFHSHHGILSKVWRTINCSARRGDGHHFRREWFSKKSRRGKWESRLAKRKLNHFVDGILLVKWPPFMYAGKAINNKVALEKGERVKKTFQTNYPFNRSDVREALLQYAEMIKEPKDLFPEPEEYVEVAEFVLQNYRDIKRETNSPGVAFNSNKLKPFIRLFMELERMHQRKHPSSREKGYIT